MISEANPVFVKIDKYKEILQIVEVINRKVVNVKKLLSELESLKNREETEIMNWEKDLDEISGKIEALHEELER
jgi:hypothetical protein